MPRTLTLLLATLLGISTARVAASDAFFEQQIRPLLVKRCYECHSGTKSSGGLLLDSAEGWQKGGDSGPAIIPGDPDRSLLVQAVEYQSLEMPPPEKGGQLTANEIANLRKWIADGARDPRTVATSIAGMSAEAARKWWSFQPLPSVSAPPTPAQIDQFLNKQIAARRLQRTAQADKRTLIRRVTYDLTGLPPTPDEVQAFLRDESETAFTRVVDRLLDSGQYGVKFGRHWLDVVRYADTAGENTDRPLPHAWRYRNWVIDAFNRDMPFDEFVRLQVSGDLLRATAAPDERDEGVVATGYLAIARRFGHDIDHNLPLMYEDAIDNLGKSFLGLTISCARCHDHKYDPFTQADYYALFGILDSTKFSFPGCEPRPQPSDLVPLTVTQAPPAPTETPAVAYAVVEGKVQDARIQLGGDAARLGDLVPRRWLSVFGGEPVPMHGKSGRRELADWIVDHPLTARVVVNRVWQWHFGRGLVATPNDFGSRGAAATHPALLDWLAAYFRANGSRMKPLHRLILQTDAYQRQTATASDSDPENSFLASFTRRRLSAEEIRDSLLLAAGKLDLSTATAHPFPQEATWKFTQHDPFSAVYPTNRRSVYLMVQRQRRHPYLALFDGADPNASTGVRQTTTAPTQALYFLNSPFLHEQASGLVTRAMQIEAQRRLSFVYEQLFQRGPTEEEGQVAQRLLGHYPGSEGLKWAALARALLTSNEFMFVE